MRELAGRNKGREEGDVRTIRQGGGNGCGKLLFFHLQRAERFTVICVLRLRHETYWL
jgi:hypothetical protein